MNFFFPKIKYYQIDEKFKIILVPLQSNIISSSITVDVGSVNETDEELGLAHFFEHMIFKGTKKRTSLEIAETLDSIGAIYNASTSYDYTNYYISGNKIDTILIIDILFDLFMNPIFPKQDIANEIKIVIEEFKMGEDNHKRQTIFKLMELLYKKTDIKYSLPVIGKPEYIKNFSQEKLISFYNHYKNGNKIFSLIGNFDEEQIKDHIFNIFNKKLEIWIPDFIKLEKKLKINFYNSKLKPRCEFINTSKLNQFIVLLGFRSVNTYNKWDYPISLLSNILCSGMSSRLFILLRNKLGFTYYQQAYDVCFKNHGYYSIMYGINPDSLNISLSEVLKELKNLVSNGITNEELNKSKKMFETSLLLNLQNSNDYGHYIINNVINKIKPITIKKIFSILEKITVKHINTFIKKVFVKSNLFLVINGHDISSADINKIIKDF